MSDIYIYLLFNILYVKYIRMTKYIDNEHNEL